MGERLPCTQEVVGSSPIVSIFSKRSRRRLLPEPPPGTPGPRRLAWLVWFFCGLLLFLTVSWSLERTGLSYRLPSLLTFLDPFEINSRAGIVAGFFAVCAGIMTLPATTGLARLAMGAAVLGLAGFSSFVGIGWSRSSSLESIDTIANYLFLIPTVLLGASIPLLILRYLAGWQINLPTFEPPEKRSELTLSGIMLGIVLFSVALGFAQRGPESSRQLFGITLLASTGGMMVIVPMVAWLLLSDHPIRAFLIIQAMTGMTLALVWFTPWSQSLDIGPFARFVHAFIGYWGLVLIGFRLHGGYLWIPHREANRIVAQKPSPKRTPPD